MTVISLTKSGHSRYWLLLAVLMALLLVLVVLAAKIRPGSFVPPAIPDPAVYQLVVTTNSQLYYGKLTAVEGQWPVLRDVFYLRERPQELQAGKGAEKGAGKGSGPQFNLTKLGSEEIHGSDDTLYLNRDQILYWVNLVPDSPVIKTIRQYKDQQK